MYSQMHNRDAVASLIAARAGKPPNLNFVSPVSATMIAASILAGDRAAHRITFDANAEGYAKTIGLTDVIQGCYEPPKPGGLQGVRYTKLTKLATHVDVDACNAVISDLIEAQLAGFSPKTAHWLTKIVGELHDNVASHASGAGFSAAQVYNDGSNRRIEFAVADAGQGMLRNVRRVDQHINGDAAAIAWCMQRGHTTASPADFFAQRLPEDAYLNPYPDGTPTSYVQDHHVGEGLWKLSELVRVSRGSLWVMSGNGVFRMHGNRPISEESSFRWEGVAVEFQVVVPRDGRPSPAQERNLDDLARRLGL